MSLASKAVSSSFWSFLTQFGHQFFTFVVAIILARFLEPETFGLLAIMAVFVSIGRVLIDGGLGASLIRTANVSQAEYSTIFYANILASIGLYVMMYIGSPAIANYFDKQELVTLLRIYGLVFVIGSFSLIQNIRITKSLQFKTHFRLTLPSLLLSGSIGIYMAWVGYEIWSLIVREVTYYSLVTLQYWIYGKWRPTWEFNWISWNKHFSFGYKIALSDIIKKFSKNIYNLFIAKLIGINQLGYYNRARSLEQLPTDFVFSSLNKVLYPLLSNQDSLADRLKDTYRRVIRLVALVVLPVLGLMTSLTEDLVVILLTDKWIPTVPILRILLLASIVSSTQRYFTNIAKVKGRSDLVLQLTWVQLVLSFLAIIPLYFFGMLGLLWGLVGASLLHTIYSGWRIGGLINYGLFDQFRDLQTPLFMTLISVFVVVLTREFWAFSWPAVWQRFLGLGALFIFIYSTFLLVLRPLAFTEIRSLVKRAIPSRKP